MAQDEVPQDNRPQDAVPAPVDPALRRRVSDLEREQVADILRDAAGEGRLSYTELEERLETLYSSKTYGELVPLTADLPNGIQNPDPIPQHAGAVVPNGTGPVISAFLGEAKRRGPWVAPQRQEVSAILGEVELDYTEAQLPYDEIYVEVKAILGEVKIRVPANAVVLLDSNPVLGSVGEEAAGLLAAPDPGIRPKTFHIRGTAILGEIKIKRGPRLTKRLGLT